MNFPQNINIDVEQGFERFPNAPIVEAVIHWQTTPDKQLEYQQLVDELITAFPNYTEPKKQHQITISGEFETDGSTTQSQSTNWLGARIESPDGQLIAQFRKDGFVFSHLKPYTNWQEFESEALRLWKIYKQIFEPTEIQRLGVRFVNRIEPVTASSVDNFLEQPPCYPGALNLPLAQFMQHFIFDVPGHPYQVQVVKTIQPASLPKFDESGLILDIDAFTTKPSPIPHRNIKAQLAELQWLKNKLFTECLKQDVFELFREETEE